MAAAAAISPYAREAARLAALAGAERDVAQECAEEAEGSRTEADLYAELDEAFSRTGIQSYALEGILGELQVCYVFTRLCF